MTLEYVLLLSAFFFLVASSLIGGPHKSFDVAGFKLSARVEKHLITGEGFAEAKGRPLKWEEPR